MRVFRGNNTKKSEGSRVSRYRAENYFLHPLWPGLVECEIVRALSKVLSRTGQKNATIGIMQYILTPLAWNSWYFSKHSGDGWTSESSLLSMCAVTIFLSEKLGGHWKLCRGLKSWCLPLRLLVEKNVSPSLVSNIFDQPSLFDTREYYLCHRPLEYKDWRRSE